MSVSWPDHLPRILSDQASFPDLRRAGALYVDKTNLIYQLQQSRLKYVFLARPRRFGKSLLVSTLESLFQGGEENRALFGETAIYPQWNWTQKQPVIRLDMSLTTGPNRASVRQALQEHLEPVYEYYRREEKIDLSIPSPDQAPRYWLSHLIEQLFRHYQRGVVVLIDEYDAPITDLIETRGDLTGVLAELREFYRVLKAKETCLYFVFITGISRFIRTGLFSALNNLRDISLNARYSSLCGFTESELTGVLAPYIDSAAHNIQWDTETLGKALRDYYNGYRFSAHSPTLYNPFSLLRCLEDMHEPEAACAFRGDSAKLPNHWSESGTPEFLVRLVQSGRYNLRLHPADPVTALRTSYDPQKPRLIPLMVQTGYYTLKGNLEDSSLYLDYANQEVRTTFADSLLEAYMGEGLAKATHRLRQLYTALRNRDYQQFGQLLAEIFAAIPYDHLQHENHYHAVIHGLGVLMSVPIQSEVHSQWGRADMVITFPDHVCVVEVKRNATAEDAIRQIEEKQYTAAHVALGLPVIGVGLNFNDRGRQETVGRTPWEIAAQVLYEPTAEVKELAEQQRDP